MKTRRRSKTSRFSRKKNRGNRTGSCSRAKGGMFRSATKKIGNLAIGLGEEVLKSKTQDEFKSQVKSWEKNINSKENQENQENLNIQKENYNKLPFKPVSLQYQSPVIPPKPPSTIPPITMLPIPPSTMLPKPPSTIPPIPPSKLPPKPPSKTKFGRL